MLRGLWLRRDFGDLFGRRGRNDLNRLFLQDLCDGRLRLRDLFDSSLFDFGRRFRLFDERRFCGRSLLDGRGFD